MGDDGAEPLRPPPMDDHRAVARWRDRVHGAWLEGDPPTEACGHRPVTIAGVRCLRAGPDEGRSPSSWPVPLVVYLHGGGYALGSPEVALPITRRLAAGVDVVSVDYRLAPEHPCPAAIDDATAVYRTVAAEGRDQPVVVAGDSAGANLALSVALAARRGDGPRVAGLVLLSPHVVAGRPPSATSTPADPGRQLRRDRPSDLDESSAAWLATAYRGSLPIGDHRLSPGLADLRDLPPMLIQVGTIDTAFEQAIGLARRARTAGVDVTLDVWAGLWHTWHYHRDLPEADRAIAEAVTFITGVG